MGINISAGGPGWFARRNRLFLCLLIVTGLCVAISQRLSAQAGPSGDPAPLALIMTRIDKGDQAGAERLMKDNLPVTKQRLERMIADFDEKFDEAGRYGATSGHDIHQEVIEKLLVDVRHELKLFDLYSHLTGDATIFKRMEARRLRYEGAYLTHGGEDLCGDKLDWEGAQKRYSEALDRLNEAFALAKETNDVRLMASTKNNVGSTLIRLVQPDKALQAYDEAARYAQRLSGEMYKGLVNLNLGNTYDWIGEPEASLRYSEAALASFKKMGRETWQANAMLNIGAAYIREQRFSSAWETLRSTLDLAKQSGEDRVRGQALLNLGMVAYQLKKPEAASIIQEGMDWFAKEGADVYTSIQRDVVQQDGLRILSRIARDQGDQVAAQKYERQYMELVNTDPDRYESIKASPCFAIYQARPKREQGTGNRE